MRERYQLTLAAVSHISGFSAEEILTDRCQLCTDARYLLVHLLSDAMPCHQIVHYTGLSKQCVSQCTNRYADRAKYNRSLQLSEKKTRELLQSQTGYKE